MNETIIKLSVRGQRLVCNAPDYLVSDSINYLDVLVDFSHESAAAWRALDVWLHLRDETGQIYDVELKEGKAKGLALSAGAWTVWLHGTDMTDGMPTIRITSDSTSFWVKHYAEERPGPLPAVPLTAAEQVAANAAWAKAQTQKLRQDMDGLDEAMSRTAEAKTQAERAAQVALSSQERAADSEKNAKASEESAQADSGKAQQAMADLLAMLGSDVATLVGGKLPMSQIPATATQEIHTVAGEEELTGLTAQRGDLAELVDEVNGERTITKTWQCLGDASIRENWVVWGTSYAVQAGNAGTADHAVTANTINGHRLVEMTQEQFDQAVKDPDTYYLIYDPAAEVQA